MLLSTFFPFALFTNHRRGDQKSKEQNIVRNLHDGKEVVGVVADCKNETEKDTTKAEQRASKKKKTTDVFFVFCNIVG